MGQDMYYDNNPDLVANNVALGKLVEQLQRKLKIAEADRDYYQVLYEREIKKHGKTKTTSKNK